MITEYYYNIVGGCIAFGSIIGSFPFRWSYKNRKIYASTQNEWINQFFIFMFYLPHYILQTIKVIWFQICGDFNSIPILYIAWVFATAILIQAMVQIFKLTDIRRMFTLFNKYLIDFKVSFIRDHDRRTLLKMRILDMLSTCCMGCIVIGVCFGTFHHAIFPSDPTYVGSLIAEQDLNIPLVYFTLVFGYFTGLVFMFTLVGLQVNVMMTYTYVMAIVLLPEFRTGRQQSKYESVNTLRTFQKLPLQYRCLQLLHSAYLNVGACLIVPLQALGTNHILFCNFTLITKWENMKDFNKFMLITWSVVGMVFIAGLLDCAGKLCSIGEKTLVSWKFHDWGSPWRNKHMAKFRKSCKPIRVHYGNSYTIRKVTVLKFLRGIVRGTFRSLLTLKT
ncbi:unnamed protein product [Orchesella dallaii]|uniref:Odorant receptor n=1 Tax=Orchesella dallaii TaxID=48710 RepID=A0ABP1S827_9HEXA